MDWFRQAGHVPDTMPSAAMQLQLQILGVIRLTQEY